MFLIAGIQPRTRKGPRTDLLCPQCGLRQVYQRRLDHYFSLFFLPLIRVKKGAAFFWCERCQAPLHQTGGDPETQSGPRRREAVCSGCGEHLAPDFRYCPHCGRPRP
ncbi:MAG: zinc ribbon domain-containing protein [Desulfosarcinaceae bacterium]|nr:zinc ribbon domain-containing protein [Desulfosarcinaceae bacterium]